VIVGALLATGLLAPSAKAESEGYIAADKIEQSWQIQDGRLKGSGKVELSGLPGDRFRLLSAPAVLDFDGVGVTAKMRVRIVQRDLMPVRQAPGGAESGDTAADDGDVADGDW
jgi:hypothetical protein